MQETWVWSLIWKDPLEKEMATHSSIPAWEIPRTEDPGGLQSMGSQRVGHDLVTEKKKTKTGYTMCWFDIIMYHKKIITWAAAYTFIILHNYYFLFCVISTFKIYCISNFQVYDTILLTMCSVVKLCLILYDAMDCSPPGSSVHGIFQATLLECVAISFSIYKL